MRSVLRQVEGVTDADRRTLKRSARAGLVGSLRDLDGWQDPQLLSNADVAVEGVGLFTLRARTDDLYHVLPAREQALIGALRQLLRPGDMFVDAGANIGFFTVLGARLVGADGKVIAIEMMPDTAAVLREHIRRNQLQQVTVVESALSERSGETVEATLEEGKFGLSSIVRSTGASGRGARSVSVRTTTLNDILEGTQGQIAAMKMDVEDAELLALKGADRVLDRIRAIIFEGLAHDTRVRSFLEANG